MCDSYCAVVHASQEAIREIKDLMIIGRQSNSRPDQIWLFCSVFVADYMHFCFVYTFYDCN